MLWICVLDIGLNIWLDIWLRIWLEIWVDKCFRCVLWTAALVRGFG